MVRQKLFVCVGVNLACLSSVIPGTVNDVRDYQHTHTVNLNFVFGIETKSSVSGWQKKHVTN